ncbi:glucuronate isomerase [Gorillibacterium timonense]|uniref:glucuronate isomerase n=1 Tax=Gorillibacterium timonense TaxID=1689269 RepID=UPI00071C7F44|nr:glucuronate isomerase [Gorillibacterium timonense]
MFLNDDFLLTTEAARNLYHRHAKRMPIIDYHCHLDPGEILANEPFRNLTEAWLAGDHYKWRLMRANGIAEEFITGNKSDYDKFLAWADTVPRTVGNPMFAWTHLELRRFFGITELLNRETAPRIWEQAGKLLATEPFYRRNLAKNARVKVICTTDDPTDSLKEHQQLRLEEPELQVLPTFRPDRALQLNAADFPQWLKQLEEAAECSIASFSELVEALSRRAAYFHDLGCRLSDHAIDWLRYESGDEAVLEELFAKRLAGDRLTDHERAVYQTELLSRLLSLYRKLGWTLQLHLHAYRNNNSAMLKKIGANTGFDALNDRDVTEPLSRLLDRAESGDGLPQTILYSLNPKDYPAIATLMGCYQKETPGKLQLGSGWWFNDTRNGMRQQLKVFADNSLLAHFVGMLTDSRSFLSYTRHEYFRRVLCELIGEWVERGEAPADEALLGRMVEDISYGNAARYFGFGNSYPA